MNKIQKRKEFLRTITFPSNLSLSKISFIQHYVLIDFKHAKILPHWANLRVIETKVSKFQG